MDVNVILGFISIVVTLLCAYLGALLHRKTERIKIMEGQLSEKRYSAYAKLYDFFYDMFKNSKDNKTINNREMRNRLLEAKKELIMYGTDEVVFALNSYLSSLTEEDIYKQVDSFLDVMVLIRRDMCGETKINRDAILLNIMQDEKELQKFKYMRLNNLEL
ncbi:hypothetical protein J5A68_00870 [Prevotella melaninogenica]|uniref:hypothetical protein n=1 Tax=Prevotella melaninogenica TaxID=28132 RepID=UPI001BABE3D7|nr:hypothetical protein [Prevotella melaninogenica]QUB65304.1 hypothetical protein J5A57_07110 [Prevotella melaninogenica]QUB68299.1 hypothetical protein J5A68_00870 [Prevotella melaninogenica]